MSKSSHVAAFFIGALFGVGLYLSGMIYPRKVQDFLDFSGRFDASLLFVLGGAVGVTFLVFPRILRQDKPALGPKFHLPTAKAIDGKLLLGAALFGIGWGLAGFCPGPALVGLLTGSSSALIFVAAMLAGMGLEHAYQRLRQPAHHA